LRALRLDGKPLRTGELMHWAPGVLRPSVSRAAYKFAVPVGRLGNEALWRLRPDCTEKPRWNWPIRTQWNRALL